MQLLALQANRFDQGVTIAAVSHMTGSGLLTRAISVARAMTLRLTKAAAEAICAERDVAAALA